MPFASRSAIHAPVVIGLVCALTACDAELPNPFDPENPGPPPEPDATIFEDVTSTHLPSGLGGLSMDAAVGDVDGDGDLDIVVAQEFAPNVLLLNDGSGSFSNASGRLPSDVHDSEDVALADFDLDGDLDVVIVSEDDRTNEFYRNDGSGRFVPEGDRIPVRGTTNGLAFADLSGDGAPDLILGNAGQNVFLLNDGGGRFIDETSARMPSRIDVTQDVELGDVDGDGDLDLLVGNENGNRLLLNEGDGHFLDGTDGRLPPASVVEETREADFGDIDGDGDLDILFANVRSSLSSADPANRLLVNDGTGTFADGGDRLPRDLERSFDGDFIDLDDDGDLDILTSNLNRTPGVAALVPWIAYRNDGTGRFIEATAEIFPDGVVGFGFDAEAADFNGDGRTDLYLAGRGSPDRLLLGIR